MATQRMGLVGEIRAGGPPTYLYNLITPDFSRGPKRSNVPFQGAGNFPTCTVVFNQRRVYISTTNKPLTLFASAIAGYEDFSLTDREDGSFELTLDSRSYDPINFAISSQFGLILFSERNVWFVVSREGGGINASNAFIKGELNSGSKKDLAPLNVLNNIIFISNLDNTPRVLVPVNTTPNQFSTQDLALYSQHFFGIHKTFIEDPALASTFDPRHRSGAEIIAWTYAGRPSRVLWAVRADGVMLSCTYSPEHKVNAWSKHATKGRFRSVQSVYERNSDTVYMVVERGGHKFIECLSKRDVSQLEDSVPVDAAVRTKNQEPSEPTILRIYDVVSGDALGEDSDDRFTLHSTAHDIGSGYTGLAAIIPDTSSAVTFASTVEDDYLKTRGGVYRITEYRNSRTLRIEKISEVDVKDPEYFVHKTEVRHPIFQWEIVTQNAIAGAYHLQDQEIMTLEGQDDPGEPVRVTYDRTVGSGGGLTTGVSNGRGLVAGLPFKSFFTSLPIINDQIVVENKPHNIKSLGLRCLDSAAMRAGIGPTLYPVFFNAQGEPEALFKSGVFTANIGGSWSLDEALYIESLLPFNILGLTIEYDLGDVPGFRTKIRGGVEVQV